MRRTMSGTATALLALVLTLAIATAARAVPVQTTTTLNLRAGPGVSWAVVATMPAGEVIDLRGCQGTWCFVVYRGSLGWASGRHLARIPVRPRMQPRFPLLDLFDPQGRPGPRYEAPPPPVAPPPRVIERPAPRPEPQPQRRARPEPSPAPQQRPPERPSAPRGGGGLLRDAAPVVNVPRPDGEPQPRTRSRDGADAPARTPDVDAGTDAGTPGERRLRREGAGGTTGSDVL
ncbi:SH3 domain-containing protein [Salinarimonas chemoclinalis]|uniref:SH3 domain-containing protein n=1 Tax=Salinarimonas chemoclinalis TaxID=3241599 RepID=UPI0035582810